MVFKTKNSYNEHSDISDVPPWCSSGRLYERRKPQKVMPARCIKSFYPLRDNIWEYINNDKIGNLETAKTETKKKSNKQTLIKRSKCRNAKFLTFFLLALGLMSQYLRPEMLPTNLLMQFLSKVNYISYLGMGSTPVNEECCHRMKYLALALNRAEQALRYSLEIIVNSAPLALRHRKSVKTFENLNGEYTKVETETKHIKGALAMVGRNTTEWGGNVALWGVLPLWRAAPLPDTVLKLQKPTPSDCWPFRGSYGEIIIDMPRKLYVTKISVEHIRPDTARSAPKNFTVFGILNNGTWIKTADKFYENNKPAKQYFNLDNTNIAFQQIVFRVLTNQGNIKYTCIYRLHFYTSNS